MLFNIFLTIFLVLLNGFFVAAEFAIVKVRSSQIELRIRSGSKVANLTKHIINNLDEFLSATQLGITLASLGLGWIGESVVARIIHSILFLFGFDISQQLTHSIALPTAFVLITIMHIVFGELAPKSIAIQRPENTALLITIPLRIFNFIFRPFILILNSSANYLISLIGFHNINSEQELHSSDELIYLIDESAKSGIFDSSEQELIENVFAFSDIPIKQIMVPRNKVVGIDISMKVNDILNKFKDEGYSRMPVYENSMDNIIGVLYAKDMIALNLDRDSILPRSIIRNANFVQEDQKINIILKIMQKKKVHLAIVNDEFGGSAGLVTMEDIIEEVFGEIQDEYDEELPIVENQGVNRYLIKASSPINDVNDFLPLPLPESDDYETVAGLILSKEGRIPELNEIIELDDYQCTITKRSKRSIEQVCLIYFDKNEEIINNE